MSRNRRELRRMVIEPLNPWEAPNGEYVRALEDARDKLPEPSWRLDYAVSTQGLPDLLAQHGAVMQTLALATTRASSLFDAAYTASADPAWQLAMVALLGHCPFVFWGN